MSPASVVSQDKRHDPPKWVEVACGHVAIRFRQATCGTGITEVRRRNLDGRRGSLYISSSSLYIDGVDLAKKILSSEPKAPSEPLPRPSIVERPRYADTDLLDPDTRILGSITRIEVEKSANEEDTSSEQPTLF